MCSPSKFAKFLPRQTGAALFRTTTAISKLYSGPKAELRRRFHLGETRRESVLREQRCGYRYTLRDSQGHKLQDMAGRETFFVRHDYILFHNFAEKHRGHLNESLRSERNINNCL